MTLSTERARLAAILVLALVLRLAFFSGYVGGDDAAYVAHAFAYANGDLSAPYSHWGVRVGIVAPTALAFKVFGVSTASIAGLPMVLSLIGVGLAFLLGRYLFNPGVGLLSALFVAVFPMEVIFASELFPNAFLSTTLTGVLLLFLHGLERRSGLQLFAAGLLLGVAYLAHETALYTLLFFALYSLWARPSARLVAWFGCGLLLVVGAEALMGVWQSGDALQRLHTLVRVKAGGAAERTVPTLGWMIEPFVRPLFEQEIGPWWVLMLAALCYATWRWRDRPQLILALWCVSGFLYLSYGTTSPTQYSTLRRLPRYLAQIIIPWLVLTASFVAGWRSVALRRAVVGGLAIVSIAIVAVDNSPYETWLGRRLAVYAEAHPGATFVIPRSLYYDMVVARGMAFDPRLTVYVHERDESHELKRIQIVHPAATRVTAVQPAEHLYVIVDGSYLKEQDVEPLARLRKIETVAEPDRLYHRVIASPLVVGLLRWVRDEKRLTELLRGTRRSFSIYSNAAS